MSGDINSLVQQVHDYFLHLFQQQSTTAPGSTFLLFEPIGTPITPDMFKLHPTDTTYSQQLAVEQFSFLVNTVPDISADVFMRTSKTVDDFYDILLLGAQPTDANTDQLFAATRDQAEKKFDPTLGSLLRPLIQFHPSYAMPNDWYDSSVAGNWTAYSTESSQSTAPPDNVGVSPIVPIFKPIHPVGPWTWRLLPSDLAAPALVNRHQLEVYAVNAERATNPAFVNSVAQPSQPASSTIAEATHVKPATLAAATTASELITPSLESTGPPVEKIETTTLPASAIASGAAAHPILETVDTTAQHVSTIPVEAAPKQEAGALSGSTIDVSLIPRPSVVASELSPLIIKHTTVQQVTTSAIRLSFSYCLISIDRDWLLQTFLNLPNWYVQGYPSGAFSNGTIQNNSGVFPVLPIACLVVKDLQLSAQWTQEDLTSIQQAASLGPFSLAGRSLDSSSTTLTASGMQVIGWISQVMPLLPPAAPPPQS